MEVRAIVVVVLAALHLQIGYGIIEVDTKKPPLQSASFEQNCPSSHVKGSVVPVAIVVVVLLVVLHLQHFQSQLHGTHSPPLQCPLVEQNFFSSHCISLVVVVVGSVVVVGLLKQ